MPFRLTADAETPLRHNTGMTTAFWITRSFILTNSAARVTGSSSETDALSAGSYSSLRQRVMFRPCHLLALADTSRDVNWFMKYWGSGALGPLLYICRSA